VLLEGDFGSGKTTFTQGIAKGMGFDDRYVNSPTFTLINEYKAPAKRLYHIDLYRLDGDEEVATLGLDDYFDGSGVTVIEWPQGAATWLPSERLLVRLDRLSETKRTLRLYATGQRYRNLLELFKKEAYGT
jgi:tRNA threonylcarbamoyladenosine biosynthesis protein TsaE